MRSSVAHRIAALVAAGATGVACPAPPTDVVEVPFEFVHDSIVVQAKIAGKGPFDVLLDTGVDPSVVDSATAAAIGVKVASRGVQGSGSGSEVNLGYATTLALVEIGGLRARNVAALAVDLSKLSEPLGRPIVGVLGYSLLKDRIVQFDYRHRVVRFLRDAPRRSSKSNDAAHTSIPFRYRDEILIDDMTVGGRHVVGNLDTGSNATFQMAPAAVAALGLEEDAAQGEATRSIGFNGPTVNRNGRLDRITIGTLTIDRPPVVFLGRNGGHDAEQWGVRIGNAFLRAYLVTIDYRHRRITLDAD